MNKAAVSAEMQPSEHLLTLPAELTHSQAEACCAALGAQIDAQASQAVVCHTQAMQRFDSSALAVLLYLRRECQRHGKMFVVADLSGRLFDLAQLYGVAQLLHPMPATP